MPMDLDDLFDLSLKGAKGLAQEWGWTLEAYPNQDVHDHSRGHPMVDGTIYVKLSPRTGLVCVVWQYAAAAR